MFLIYLCEYCEIYDMITVQQRAVSRKEYYFILLSREITITNLSSGVFNDDVFAVG